MFVFKIKYPSEAAGGSESIRCREGVNAFFSENQRMSFSRIHRFSRKKGEAGSGYAFLIFCHFFIKKKVNTIILPQILIRESNVNTKS
jgi:hypothetical protein